MLFTPRKIETPTTMSIGTGIFLSSLVIAMLLLFLRTRDRWNWKRFAIRSTAVLGAVFLVGGGLIYSYSLWQSRPKKQDEFWDVKLGDTEQDVIFKKGVATDFGDQNKGHLE